MREERPSTRIINDDIRTLQKAQIVAGALLSLTNIEAQETANTAKIKSSNLLMFKT